MGSLMCLPERCSAELTDGPALGSSLNGGIRSKVIRLGNSTRAPVSLLYGFIAAARAEGKERMRLWIYGATGLLGVSVLWLMSGTQRERPILSSPPLEPLGPLEGNATSHPNDPDPTRRLAQAYLDARQPGLAVVLLDAARSAVRSDVRVQHIRARALLDQGRNDDALTAERRVIEACRPLDDEEGAPTGCDDVLVASARRRVAILEEMVALGVEDTQAYPEASLAAYQNATRQARVSLQ
jgi:hypothetical protein